MTSEQFVFWLQGMFELTDPKKLDAEQTATIKKHLELVFVHEIGPALEKKTPGLTDKHGGKTAIDFTPPQSITGHVDSRHILLC